MYSWPPIGENIARLRTVVALTQEELAERAEVSVDLIRRLEQGNRRTALIGSLYKLANALDVQLSVLLAQSPVFQPAEPEEHDARVAALRQVLQPVGLAVEEPEPLTLDDLKKSSRDASRLYRAGEFTNLAMVLPTTLVAGKLLAEELTGADRTVALTELSQLYDFGSGVLTQLGYEDLGYQAAETALMLARQVDDPLMPLKATNPMTFVLIRQGRMEEARALAIRTAEDHEPRFGKATPEELSIWGRVIWTGVTTAVRLGRTGAAEDVLNLLQLAAHRLGTDLVDEYLNWFGPTTVAMQAVALAAESGDYAKALDVASRIPAEGGASTTSRMRHRLDVANAQAHEKQSNNAVATLLDVRRQAPEWMRYQVLARETVAMLLETNNFSRDYGKQLHDLGRYLHVIN